MASVGAEASTTVDVRDLVAGGVIAAAGIYFFVKAFEYGVGTPTNMGAGFFPLCLGLATIAIGLVIAVLSFRKTSKEAAAQIAWRPFLAVLAGTALFALLLNSAGVIPAVFATVFLSATGDSAWKLVPTFVLATSTAILCWLIFVIGLGLPLRGINGVL